MGIITRTFWLAAACGVLLASCAGRNHNPDAVPVYDLKLSGRSSGAAVVSTGDTLTGIARRYDLTLEDIIRANTLADGGNDIAANQRLKLPAPRTYMVRSGDTLDRIARMFDTDASTLARANGLRPDARPPVGRMLQIVRPQPAPAPHVATGVTTHPRPPVAEIMPAQPAGQVERETLQPPQKLAEKQVKPEKTAKKDNAGGKRFARPVAGDVTSGYGPKTGGLFNDGVNIAAAEGTPVHAAADGTVVFAGKGPDAFGNMVLVRHADNYFTVYGHLSRVGVEQGAQLARGQTLGAVGATGKVAGPQLHFEIRQGTHAVNPEKYL